LKSNQELQEIRAEEEEKLNQLKKQIKELRSKEKTRQELIRDIESIRERTSKIEAELSEKKVNVSNGAKKVGKGLKKAGNAVVEFLYSVKEGMEK